MLDSVINYFKHLVRGVLIFLPMVALYGYVFPWPSGEHTAMRQYPGQFPVMIAELYHSKSWRDRHSGEWMKHIDETRTYVLVPSVFINPKVVIVSQSDANSPEVSESRLPFVFLGFIGLAALGAYGLRALVARPPRHYELSPDRAKAIYGPPPRN